MSAPAWDYLVVTATDERQAASYDRQLSLRRDLGAFPDVRAVLAVADPGGLRVGSGGSTIWTLLKVLERELPGRADRGRVPDRPALAEVLSGLRVLILHAGGDSRRLPPYAACGKPFVPVPEAKGRVPGTALFDALLPVYLGLPPRRAGRGQVVVTTGDVLLSFDAASVALADEGVTGLGSYEPPGLASNHGVFCPDAAGRVRRFLQKPSPAEQAAMGALGPGGRALLDIGVMSLDPRGAAELAGLVDIEDEGGGRLRWRGAAAKAIERSGLDFYREVCCAMGTEVSFEGYRESVRKAGSTLDDALLEKVFSRLSSVPFRVSPLPDCRFLHFGTPRQLIRSGTALLGRSADRTGGRPLLVMNTEISGAGRVRGQGSWVEGCRVRSRLSLDGDNVVTGVDVSSPLSLPRGAVLDVVEGEDRRGRRTFFVRCHGVDDVLNAPRGSGALLAGLDPGDWLAALGASPEDVWDPGTPREERMVWNGRFFPAARGPKRYRDWLWMLDVRSAGDAQRAAWKKADRYSFAEMARLASADAFHERRHRNGALAVAGLKDGIFRPGGDTSASELDFMLARLDEGERKAWLSGVLEGLSRRFGTKAAPGLARLDLSRALHTLGTALGSKSPAQARGRTRMLASCHSVMTAGAKRWLASLGLGEREFRSSAAWSAAARNAAFEAVASAIVRSRVKAAGYPRSVLRSGAVVMGSAPARLDLGGGWSDTPPYSLERGGSVINAAVDLDGRPPIRVLARIMAEPVIRLRSVDHGRTAVIRDLADLLDYRRPGTAFGLAKAAIALSGLSPETASWPRGARTLERMLELFGGGIELVTEAAIPSGSGLGTSSIMGAALLAVLYRLTGRRVGRRALFHDVLRLEQELTTGGGWQDQIGGVVGGVKVIESRPGLVPDPRVRAVPADLLDPATNGGTTLLYYTGIRRLAKDILRGVVGSYLNRDRRTLATLAELRAFPARMESAMTRRDRAEFGGLIDLAWRLNKRIDPGSTTDAIEAILAAARPHVSGAKLLGAGGGGFLLMVCPSPGDASAVRRILGADPPNDEARFFDYSIDRAGLVVTVR